VENSSLGSVRLRGFKIGEKWDKIFLLVSWNGVPVRLDSSGKPLPDKRMNRIFRDLFVLTRKHGSKSNLKNAITSSHCPSCGANTESSFATSCEYCGSSLNEGSKSWILEKVTTERDNEYLDAISRPRKKISDDECLSTEQRSARDIVTITAQLLLADGVIDPNEVNLLNKIASSYGMLQKDVDSIIENLKGGLVYIPAPQDNRQSWELLLHATRMALADGTIDESEEKSLISLAKHIGYTEMDVKRAKKVEEKTYNAQQRQKEIEARKAAREQK
jgi:tellurite resistance protein